MMDQLPADFTNNMTPANFEDPYMLQGDELLAAQDTVSWPKVHVPNSAEVSLSLNWYDWEARELKPFRNTKITKWLDGNGNRAYDVIKQDKPIVGTKECHIFWNFEEKTVVLSDPKDKKQCYQFDLPEAFNLREFIDKLKKQEGGLSVYLGTKTVRWSKDDKPKYYYAFRIEHEFFGMESTKIVYFDWDTKELSYIEVIKPFFMVIEVAKGLKERDFTDEDFRDLVTECPRMPSFLNLRKLN